MLNLAFHGNGPYWTDFLYLPAYPTGMSYTHEFRYSESLVSDSVRSAFVQNHPVNQFVGKRIVLGARFNRPDRLDEEKRIIGEIHEFEKIYLPIRYGTCIEARFVGGIYQFYFKLDRLFDFRRIQSLDEALVELPENAFPENRGRLAFEIPLPEGTRSAVESDAAEHEAWASFVRGIALPCRAPINQEARRSLYFRIQRPIRVDSGEDASIGKIRKAASQPETFGFELKEGFEYSIPIYYSFPDPVTRGTSVSEALVNISEPGESIEFSERELKIIGNYGSRDLNIFAHSPTKSIVIKLNPPEEMVTQESEPVRINGRSLDFSVRFKRNLYSRFKRGGFPTLILFFSLMIIATAPTIMRTFATGNPMDTQEWISVLITGSVSAVATFIIRTSKN